MRKITLKTAEAFLNRRAMKMDNTEVKGRYISTNGKGEEIKDANGFVEMYLYLHGNLIANFNQIQKGLYFTLAGWNTPTTRERLNGLFEVYGLTCKVRQIKGEAYIQTPSELVKIDADSTYVIGGGKNTNASIVKDFQNTEAIDTASGWVMPEEVEEFSQKIW